MILIGTIDREGNARPGIGTQPVLRHGIGCDCWTCAERRAR